MVVMILWHIPVAIILIVLYLIGNGIAWVAKHVIDYRQRHEPKGP